MTRKFKTVDYEAALDQTVSLREALPANHLARFVVDIVAELDLAHIYERYGLRGGEAYAPELLLALLFYGYATGVFSSRKIEKATYEMLPFRFVAGGLHPDHDTLANFRKTFRAEIKDLFVQVLLLARRPAISSSATSAGTAPRCRRMLPRVRPSATSACWHWKAACGPKSISCFCWPNRPMATKCPQA